MLLCTVTIWSTPEEMFLNAPSAAFIWAVYAAFALIYVLLERPVPLGMGDVEILSILALHTGGPGIMSIFAASGVLAGIFAAVLLALGKVRKDSQIPFAPFIAAGYAIYAAVQAFPAA